MVGKKMELGATGEAVAQNVKRIREATNLTYTDVSKTLAELSRPMSPLAVRRIEDGERRVDVDDLMALALALRVAPVSLLVPPTSSEEDEVVVTGLASPVAAGDLWGWVGAEKSLVPWKTDMELMEFFANSMPGWRRHWFGSAIRRMAEEARTKGGNSGLEDLHSNWLSEFGPDGND